MTAKSGEVKMSDIEKASKLLKMTPQTLRLFIREGKFGVAIKRKRWVYKVNWEEVYKHIDTTITISDPEIEINGKELYEYLQRHNQLVR